jgi:hypothetical protein
MRQSVKLSTGQIVKSFHYPCDECILRFFSSPLP